MAGVGELTETSKLYARCVASIQPEWLEALAPHLVKYHYFEPHWEKAHGEVVAKRAGDAVRPEYCAAPHGVVWPGGAAQEAREIFLREALANGQLSTQAPFTGTIRR